MSNSIDRLEKLDSLRKSGAITEIEFEGLKSNILNESEPAPDIEAESGYLPMNSGYSSEYMDSSSVNPAILIGIIAIALIAIFVILYNFRFFDNPNDKFIELIQKNYASCADAKIDGQGYSCSAISKYTTNDQKYRLESTEMMHSDLLSTTAKGDLSELQFDCSEFDELSEISNSVSGGSAYTRGLYKAVSNDLISFILNNTEGKFKNITSYCVSMVSYSESGDSNDSHIFEYNGGYSTSAFLSDVVPETEDVGKIVLANSDRNFTIREPYDADEWKKLHLAMRTHLFHKISADINSGDSPLRKYYPAANFGSLLLGGSYRIDEALQKCVPGIFALQSDDNIERLYVREFTGTNNVSKDVDDGMWSLIAICIYGVMSK